MILRVHTIWYDRNNRSDLRYFPATKQNARTFSHRNADECRESRLVAVCFNLYHGSRIDTSAN